jgi:hypothetical protein
MFVKKVVVLAVLVVCLAGASTVNALVPDNLNASSSKIVTEGINNVAEDQAEMLKSLGLFVGTNNGFELHRHLTRAEAATLIVRLMGEESNALIQKNKHPFKDVPLWADSYVGWLYKNKITYGVDETRYGSTQNVTYWQFATMLSRISLGHDDFISSGVGKEDERNYIDRVGQDPPGTDFFRADAVSMMTRFMQCAYLKDQDEVQSKPMTVAQYLIEKNAFTAELFLKSAVKVYPITYSRTEEEKITSFIAGVALCESKLAGISGDTTYPAADTLHFYAWKFEGGMTILYRMDCHTLEEIEVARWTEKDMPKPWRIVYFATFNGESYTDKDLLGVWYEGGVSLVTSDGMEASEVAAGKNFGIDRKPYWEPFLWDGDRLVTAVDNTVYIFTKNSMTSHVLAPDVVFIGTENGLAVLYSEKDNFGVIQGVRLDDWTVTDTYQIPLADKETSKHGYPLIRQYYGKPYDDSGGAGIYGEAGLFTVREGRLEHITSRPTLDLSFVRVGAGGAHVILSHEPGTHPVGTTIYQYNGPMITGEDGYEEVERLGNDPPHGILISSIEGRDSMVFFDSRSGVGMGNYDIFTYYPFYNSEEGHMGIIVTSFTAGRPEISFYELDAKWHVQKEQERLNDLGYKP